MNRLWLAALLAAGCSRSIAGPTPFVGAAANEIDPSAQPAVLCNAQGDATAGWALDISGDHFAPLPHGALTDPTGVDMPVATLSGPETFTLPRSRLFFADHHTLIADVPTADTAEPHQLTPGSYSIAVANPQGTSGSGANLVTVVPAPRLSSTRVAAGNASLDPVVCADQDQTLALTGSNFRTDVALAVSVGGRPLPAPLAATATSLRVRVPADTFAQADASAAGTSYTVKIASPEGCVAPYGSDARGFGVTDVKVATRPAVTALQAQTAAGSAPPTICSNATEATLVITGSSLWSISDGSAGRLPSVQIIDGSTTLAADAVTLLPAAGHTYAGTTLSAHFTLPATPLPAGPVTVRVTNANGCTGDAPASLAAAVALCPSLGTLAVNPRFGWEQQNQPVTISNQFTLPSTQGFSGGAPLVFIRANVKGMTGLQRVPLRRVAFLDQNTISGVVPTCSGLSPTLSNADCSAGLLAGGPYDLEVLDPSGAPGKISAAFTVVANQPPVFAAGASALNPASVNGAGGSITISGAHFDTPANVHATALLGQQAAGGVEFCPLSVASASDTSITFSIPAFSAASCYVEDAQGNRTTPGSAIALSPGIFLVRVQHTGDVAFADYSGLVVVASSFNPTDNGVAGSTLVTARGSAGMAVGADDLGQPFLYAVGGSSDGVATLASVEVAPVGPFGDLGGSCSAGACKFRVLDRTPLPSARAGLSVVARSVAGDTTYLFAMGGRGGANGTNILNEVLRAQILKSSDAPAITSVSSAAGVLAGGTYYYRVSAINLSTNSLNPGGETLPSDEQPITLAGLGGASLSWSCNPGAAQYNVYRTHSPNQASGTETLLATVAATPNCNGGESFTDDGSRTTGAQKPLPPGALGAWAGAAQGVPQLGAARFDAAARLENGTIYLVGGCSSGAGTPVACSGGHELADMERATFASATAATPGAFSGAGTAVLNTKRSRLALAIADASSVPGIQSNDASKSFLIAAGGRSNDTDISGNTSTVEIADISASVANPSFISPTAHSDTQMGSGGWAEVQAGLFFWEMSGTAKSKSPSPVCSGAGCGSASNFAFNTNSGFPTYSDGGIRYLCGEQLYRAYIYAVGGFTDTGMATPVSTVERIVY